MNQDERTCDKCKPVFGFDDNEKPVWTGQMYLCPRHAAVDELVEALEMAQKDIHFYGCTDIEAPSCVSIKALLERIKA